MYPTPQHMNCLVSQPHKNSTINCSFTRGNRKNLLQSMLRMFTNDLFLLNTINVKLNKKEIIKVIELMHSTFSKLLETFKQCRHNN